MSILFNIQAKKGIVNRGEQIPGRCKNIHSGFLCKGSPQVMDFLYRVCGPGFAIWLVTGRRLLDFQLEAVFSLALSGFSTTPARGGNVSSR